MSDNSILSRLDGLKIKYEEIGQQMTDPEVIADMKKFVALNKEYKELQPVVETSEKYRTALNHLNEAKEILATEKDDELREMAREEVAELEPQLAKLEEDIKLLLIPADPQDSKNAIVEIRGGTGGDEAALFAGDLFRMYTKYIEKRGWRYEINSASEGSSGGFKEIVMKVTGSSDRNTGTGAYFGRIGCRTSGSRRVRSGDQHERCPQGYILCIGPRWTVGQHDLLGHPTDTHSDRYRRTVSGPEVTAQKL